MRDNVIPVFCDGGVAADSFLCARIEAWLNALSIVRLNEGPKSLEDIRKDTKRSALSSFSVRLWIDDVDKYLSSLATMSWGQSRAVDAASKIQALVSSLL